MLKGCQAALPERRETSSSQHLLKWMDSPRHHPPFGEITPTCCPPLAHARVGPFPSLMWFYHFRVESGRCSRLAGREIMWLTWDWGGRRKKPSFNHRTRTPSCICWADELRADVPVRCSLCLLLFVKLQCFSATLLSSQCFTLWSRCLG